MGQLEAADAVRCRAGKRAFRMPEDLAFEHSLSQAADVDGNHGVPGARRDLVQGLRDDFLARAVLAGDEHVGVRGSDLRDHVQDGLHRSRLRDQGRQTVAAQDFVLHLQAALAPERPRQFGLCADDAQEPRVVPRLLHEIAGAAAHRFHGQLDASPGRHHHHGKSGVDRPKLRQQVKSLLSRGRIPRVIQVDQDDVELVRGDRLDNLRGLDRRFRLVAFSLEQQAQSREDVRLVVSDKNFRHGGAAVRREDRAASQRRTASLY